MTRRWPAALLTVTLAALPACSAGQSEGSAGGARPEPAALVTVAGTGQKGVRLTADAARRLRLATAPVRVQPPAPGQPPQPVIPLAAVLYDKDGGTWTYTNPRPLLYVRTRVGLGPVHGDLAVLRSGPAAGTRVVTVGAVELQGTEFGVGGEQ